MWKKVSFLGINILLLVIYAYCFGYKSIQKYLDSGVIIVELEEKNGNLPPPSKVFMIYAFLCILFSLLSAFVTRARLRDQVKASLFHQH